MKPDYILAIDPGASGAAVVIDPNITTSQGAVQEVRSFRSAADVVSWLTPWLLVSGNWGLVIEKIHPSPIQPPSSAGAMMRNVGVWEGILAALFPSTPIHEVTAHEWQFPLRKQIPEGVTSGPPHKRALKTIATEQWSDGRVTLANCDALLIALHAAKKWPVGSAA